MLGMICYLDDSGSDDGSPLVTCGGPLFWRLQAKAFTERWPKLYERNQFRGYDLRPPLHMVDFAGMGKYAGLFPEFKRALFRDVVQLVHEHKLFSISIAISGQEFDNELSPEVRRGLIGPYALGFFSAVLLNQGVAERIQSSESRESVSRALLVFTFIRFSLFREG